MAKPLKDRIDELVEGSGAALRHELQAGWDELFASLEPPDDDGREAAARAFAWGMDVDRTSALEILVLKYIDPCDLSQYEPGSDVAVSPPTPILTWGATTYVPPLSNHPPRRSSAGEA